MRYQPKCLLITGGAGFIGSQFILYWLKHYPEAVIVNLDKLTYAANLDHLTAVADRPNYHFVHGDIIDTTLVTQLLTEYQIDTVVHFAAESHVDRSISGPDEFIETNVMGTHSLLKAALAHWKQYDLSPAHCRFHHISTDEVYGTLVAEDPAFTEQSPYQPNSPYSASKAASDHVVRAYHHTYGLPVTTSNCSNNYGPHQHAEKLIPTVIRSLQQRQPIPVYGDGSNIRDWLYVEDHCQAIDRILHQGEIGQVYNVGGEHEVSNLALVKQLCQHYDQLAGTTDSEKLIHFVTDRPGHDWRYAIDIHHIKQTLSWQPLTQFDQGLAKTLKYYLEMHS